jgi:hypothetical protein
MVPLSLLLSLLGGIRRFHRSEMHIFHYASDEDFLYVIVN